MMKRPIVTLVAAVLAASSAEAAPRIVRVSGKGANAANCGGVANPCRTLQYAHDAASAGDYLLALDPADYGHIWFTKSMSVANEGPGGAVVTSTEPYTGAICVTPGSEFVRIRGMTIDARANNGFGIIVNAGKRVDIAATTIRSSSSNIYFNRNIDVAFSILDADISGSALGLNVMLRSGFYASGLKMGNAVLLGRATWPPPAIVIEHSASSQTGVNFPATYGFGLDENYAVLNDVRVSGFAIALSTGGEATIRRSVITGNTTSTRTPLASAGDNVIRGNQDDALNQFTTAGALH